MSQAQSADSGGLVPKYQNYQRQKCFIAYTKQTEWAEDLLSACEEVVSKPEFNLELDYVGKRFTPDDVTLREKALELIANARYGIYDLSYWWDDQEGKWKMPGNVFIELGIAIALNRPTLLLRHANNQELELPECLKGLKNKILEFSGFYSLKKALNKNLQQWISQYPEKSWWNRYCFLGGRVCKYRETYPQKKGKKTKNNLSCYIFDSTDVDRYDFRCVIEEVLERYSLVKFTYLDALSLTEGYDFLLCTYCQNARSTPFAIYRITPNTSPGTLITLGISIALENQFENAIPKIIMVENSQDIPSLLLGYDFVEARSDNDKRSNLLQAIPEVIQKIRKNTWKATPLPFEVISLPDSDYSEPNLSNKDDEISQLRSQLADNPEVNKALDLIEQNKGDLKVTAEILAHQSGYQVHPKSNLWNSLVDKCRQAIYQAIYEGEFPETVEAVVTLLTLLTNFTGLPVGILVPIAIYILKQGIPNYCELPVSKNPVSMEKA